MNYQQVKSSNIERGLISKLKYLFMITFILIYLSTIVVLGAEEKIKCNYEWLDNYYHYNTVVVKDNIMIIAGIDGRILRTENGETFTQEHCPNMDVIKESGVVDDHFVVLGNYGQIATSVDGINWETQIIDSNYGLVDIATGDKGTIVLAYNFDYKADDCNTIYITQDAKTFTEMDTSQINENVYSCGYYGNKYVLWGSSNRLYFSEDLRDWHSVSVNKNSKYIHLYYFDNTYYVYESIISRRETKDKRFVLFTSKNLIDWNEMEINLPKSFDINHITRNQKGTYIASVENGKLKRLYESKDMKNWNLVTDKTEVMQESCFYGEDTFMVGRFGSIVINNEEGYKFLFSESARFISIVTGGNKTLIIDSSGKVQEYKNGHVLRSDKAISDRALTSGVFLKGNYYLLASGPLSSDPNCYKTTVYKSSNGEDWIEIQDFDYYNAYLYTEKDLLFMTTNTGKICVSNDGTSWSETNYVDENIYDIEYFKGEFYAISKHNLYSSSDGYTWQLFKTYEDINLTDLEVNNELLFLAADNSIITTNDNTNWRHIKFDFDPCIEKIIWNGEYFILFSGYSGAFNLMTYDGVNYYKYDDIEGMNLFEAAWNGEMNILVGFESKIVSFMPKNPIKVIYRGNPIIFDVAPVIMNNRTMVPARAIFERVGATVSWDSSIRAVKVQKGDVEIKVIIDDEIAYINDVAYTLDQPATVINGRTLVPIRFIAEALDIKVEWSSDKNCVYLE